MKLLLFDIDGTLLVTRGTGRRAILKALHALTGQHLTLDGISFSGRTDPAILRDIFVHNGFDTADVDALLPDALALFAEVLPEYLNADTVTALPGVAQLIEQLAGQEEVQLALVTGNLESTAYQKLDAVGLASYFPFGAFGSDHADRNALPPLAVHRAYAYTGHTFAGSNVVVIGDTEHDIRCSRSIGALAVAVCTGHYSRADLEPHAPDVLLDGLEDADLFMRHLLS